LWPEPGWSCPRAQRFGRVAVWKGRSVDFMSLTIYHNPRCSKSRQTLKLLRDHGQNPTIIEYLNHPPSAAELTRILQLLGMRPGDLLRRKEAGDAGIDPAALSDDQLIAEMVQHPAVIERPIVVSGNKAALGRPPEAVLGMLPSG
jgi:arsenate reductase (glutaredoxin)